MVELMIVVVIIGIITAVTLPSLVGSIRGQKLRAASSTVVKAGRYARSMAVMRQKDVRLVAIPGDTEIRVEGTGDGDLTRRLEGVALEKIELEGDADGVVYYRNGRCTPYSLRVTDVHGKSVLVKVDALGTVVTETGYR